MIVLGFLLLSLATDAVAPPACVTVVVAATSGSLAPRAASAAPDSAARPTGAHPRRGVADTVTVLSGVSVERERALSDARRLLPTAFVTDLAAHGGDRAVGTISDLLAEAAGVRVQSYGGLGAFSTVSLRGAAPGQVTILLDGVPLTSAAHGLVSLGDLPATAVERAEIYRGLGPLGLGVASPGGAVNLVTASSPGLRELHLSRGSFGTWEGRGTAGLQRGRLGLLLHAGYQGSAGDYPYVDDNGTELNRADDTVERRRNDRFDAWSGLGSLDWRPAPGWRVRAREDAFHKAQGVSGLGAVPALSTRLTFLRSLSTVEASREGAGLVPRVSLRLSDDRDRSRFRDTRLPDRGELGFGRHDTDDRSRADGLTLALAWARPAEWLAFECAGSATGESADLHDAASGVPDPPRSRRLGRGAMGQLQLRTPDGRLVLHAARRWDLVEDHLRPVAAAGVASALDVRRVLDSPQLGASLRLGYGLELRANWARASRAPGFVELFGDVGSVTGDPALRPETAENRDAGLAWRGRVHGRAATFEWARFGSNARDLIVLVRNSATTVKPMNFGSSRIRGEEWDARAELPGRLLATASWSWQSAIDLGPLPVFWVGKRLPGRPSHLGAARLEWRPGGRFDLRAAADLQVIGEDVLDPYNLVRVPEQRLTGASLSAAPWRRPLRVGVEGRNLGDVRAVDVAGFPLPGRSVFVSATWRVSPGDPGTTE